MSEIDWNTLIPPWLSEALPQGLLITDTELKIRVWNRWLEQRSGLGAEVVYGRSLLALYPELAARGLDTQFHRVLEGEPVTLMRRYYGYLLPLAPTPGQRPFPWMQQQARITPLVQAGAVIGTITTIEDMTDPATQDLRLTQTILQQEETLALLDTLIGQAPIGFAFLDPTLRYRRINAHLAQINGLPIEEHIGRSLAEIVPDLAAQQVALFRTVLESGEPLLDVELVGETPARPGVTRHWQVSYYPVQTAGRRRLGVGVLVHEISERKRQEQTERFLAEVSATLNQSLDERSILGHLARQLVPFLADWCVLDMFSAPGWERRTMVVHRDPALQGLAEEVQRRFAPQLEAGSALDTMLRAGRSLLMAEVSAGMLDTLVCDEEQLALVRQLDPRSYIIVPLISSGSLIGMLALARTASERRYTPADLALAEEVAQRAALALENMRLFAAAQAAQAVAEEAVSLRDAFFSIAAHELRTPLTTLLGRSQLLKKWLGASPGVDERSTRAIQIVVDQAQRLNKMITALLDVSRIQAGRFSIDPKPMDICAMMQRLVEETQPTLSAHTLELVGCDGPLLVAGDEVRLEQVIHNLIGNAVKYSLNGGTVRITVERAGDEACVVVRDYGIGIPAPAIGQLFRRFYRAANAEAQGVSGLGIGLFVVNEIVELHGGTIDIASVEGAGSTFTLRLPLL